MSGLRSVTFRCQGHPEIRGTHQKTVEFTRDAEITGRATCVLGVGADFDPYSLLGFRGPVAITVAAGARTAVIHAVANPGFETSASIVVRTSRHSTPNTLAVAADTAADGLDRGFVDQLTHPGVTVTVTVSELPAPSRPERGQLTILSVQGSTPGSLTPEALRSADAVLAIRPAAARETLIDAGEHTSLRRPADVDAPARFRGAEHLVYLAGQDGPEGDDCVADLGTAAAATGATVRILPTPSLETAARVLGGAAPYVLLCTSRQVRGDRAGALRLAASGGMPVAWRESPSSVETALAHVEELLGTRPVRLWISPASPQGWVLRGSAADVREQWTQAGRPPGDLVLLVASEQVAAGNSAELRGHEVKDLLARLLDEGVSARTLAQALAAVPGRDYRSEYRRVLQVKSDRAATRGSR